MNNERLNLFLLLIDAHNLTLVTKHLFHKRKEVKEKSRLRQSFVRGQFLVEELLFF